MATKIAPFALASATHAGLVVSPASALLPKTILRNDVLGYIGPIQFECHDVSAIEWRISRIETGEGGGGDARLEVGFGVIRPNMADWQFVVGSIEIEYA